MADVDDYIASFPPDVQEILRRVRAAIHRGVPGADEKIRYGMPAVMLGGRYALHFAGWKKHVGIYPVARADAAPEKHVGVHAVSSAGLALEAELAPYRAAKDSVIFVYSKPIPEDLIERVAAFLFEKHRE